MSAFGLGHLGRQVAHYLRYNPVVALKVAAYLARGKVAVPLDLLRWLALHPSFTLPDTIGTLDRLIITGRQPWLTVDAWLTLVGQNPVRVALSVRVSALDIQPGRCEVTVEFRHGEIESLEPKTPFGKLLSAGVFDIAQPASLLQYMPERPPWLAGGDGSEITFDLMKHPAFARDTPLRRWTDRWLSVIRPTQAETRRDWLVVDLRAS
jgi:hypothetical protein